MARVGWIDAARGLGIFAIVLGHSWLPGEDAAPLTALVYAFHVPLFMFLSGVTFRPSMSLRDLIGGRLRAIVVPYLVWGSVAILVFGALGPLASAALGRTPNSPHLSSWLVGLLWSNPGGDAMKWNTPLWFLTALVVVQLAGWLLLRAFDRVPGGQAVALAAATGISLLAVVWQGGMDLPWSTERALVLLPFFVAGVMVGGAARSWTPPVAIAAAVAVAGFAAMWLVVRANGTVDYVDKVYGTYWLFLLGAALGIVATLALAMVLRDLSWLQGLGRASLTVLVLHKFVVVACQVALAGFAPYPAWLGVALTIIVAIVATAVSWACHRPLQRWVPWSIGMRRRQHEQRR